MTGSGQPTANSRATMKTFLAFLGYTQFAPGVDVCVCVCACFFLLGFLRRITEPMFFFLSNVF